MERVGPLVQRQLGRLGPNSALAPLLAAWPAAVGPTVARHAWPARIGRDGTVRVHTSSSAWAFELTQLESEVLVKLRAALDDAAPGRLRFAPGPLPEPEPAPPATGGESDASPTSEDRSWGKRLAATIENAELAEAVARAAAGARARSR